MMQTLDWAYDKTVNGLPGQDDIDSLVNDYLSKYSKEEAINKLIQFQTTKAAASGFITGFGGYSPYPLAFLQMSPKSYFFNYELIAVIAKIRGFDLESDQVRTFAYATLTGSSVTDIVKKIRNRIRQ